MQDRCHPKRDKDVPWWAALREPAAAASRSHPMNIDDGDDPKNRSCSSKWKCGFTSPIAILVAARNFQDDSHDGESSPCAWKLGLRSPSPLGDPTALSGVLWM